MMKFLDRLPWIYLIVAAVLLGSVPIGQPHLIEKLRMLARGTLRRPLDWFDLFMHGSPILLMIAKAIREIALRAKA